jgi:dienelactone hydrolase
MSPPNMNLRHPCSTLLSLAFAATLPTAAFAAGAEITSGAYEYQIGGATYEGYIARPAVIAEGSMVPAVLVVHDWTGNGEFSQAKADQLAGLGYLAFAVDMYGKGIRATTAEEAPKLAGVLYGKPELFRERILAALEEVKKQKFADPDRIGAMGFCFGGTTVLELARSGADVKGVVSFHGGLKPLGTPVTNPIKAKVMILHGVRDPFVPPADVAACMAQLNDVGAWYQFVGYPEAVHSFTNPKAGNDPSKGAAYNAAAEKGAIAAMMSFFKGVLAPPKAAN